MRVLPRTDNVREIQTKIRDHSTTVNQFVFFTRRLIRLVVEFGLDAVDMIPMTVTTPTGEKYEGCRMSCEPCGVSIMRAGEAMEHGLRECLLSVRLGHILIQHAKDQSERKKADPQVYFSHLPPNISQRPVLLMAPVVDSGASVLKAIAVLLDNGVKEENLVLLTLFVAPRGAARILSSFPKLTLVTSEIAPDCKDINFSERYFGTI